jgi:hypothetical protein
MKVGLHTVSDWKYSSYWSHKEWYRIFKANAYDMFAITLYQDKDNVYWELKIQYTPLSDAYDVMFPFSNKRFDSIDVAKANVDLFLDKFNKLKVFL